MASNYRPVALFQCLHLSNQNFAIISVAAKFVEIWHLESYWTGNLGNTCELSALELSKMFEKMHPDLIKVIVKAEERARKNHSKLTPEFIVLELLSCAEVESLLARLDVNLSELKKRSSSFCPTGILLHSSEEPGIDWTSEAKSVLADGWAHVRESASALRPLHVLAGIMSTKNFGSSMQISTQRVLSEIQTELLKDVPVISVTPNGPDKRPNLNPRLSQDASTILEFAQTSSDIKLTSVQLISALANFSREVEGVLKESGLQEPLTTTALEPPHTLSSETEKILEYAKVTAAASLYNSIDPLHLLFAALSIDSGANFLREKGVDTRKLAQKLSSQFRQNLTSNFPP